MADLETSLNIQQQVSNAAPQMPAPNIGSQQAGMANMNLRPGKIDHYVVKTIEGAGAIVTKTLVPEALDLAKTVVPSATITKVNSKILETLGSALKSLKKIIGL